ncbi:MAG TPA: peptidylprolyl isomerase [Polyangia bacterium]
MRPLFIACALALVSGCGDASPATQADAAPQDDAAAPADAAVADDAAPANPVVTLVTTLGTIDVELLPTAAPVGVANFLSYVDQQYYDGTIFHRVIPDFMIQGGGLNANMSRKPTDAPIVNEAGNGLSNVRGTIAYARTADPDSATSQFFINVADNTFLDRAEASDGFGYAVFGQVVTGMDVVDTIVAVPTTTVGAYEDVPVDPVVITSARVK